MNRSLSLIESDNSNFWFINEKTPNSNMSTYALTPDQDTTDLTTPAAPEYQGNRTRVTINVLSGEVRIPLYSLIFLLSVIGNTLVIVTLAQNRRMRTVTNVFLLNLSISDMLLAVFCMPFTLIPTLLRNFIFGKTMCILIRYLQGVSVAVSVLTLVSISLERYFAICQPLRSRSWQTLSHAYKMICAVWLISFFIMVPIAIFHKHVPIPDGRHVCREIWANKALEHTYTIFLLLMLLVGPLLLMLLAYGRISLCLYQGMRLELRSSQEMRELRRSSCANEDEADTDDDVRYGNGAIVNGNRRGNTGSRRKYDVTRHHHIRHTNTEKSLRAKRRVIRMLFVVVLEFFVCWTPVYVLQTWLVINPANAQKHVTPMMMNLFHLLSYVSSCCNPITYCFMNKKFRQGFLSAFDCCGYRKKKSWREPSSMGVSQRTGKDCTMANTMANSPQCGRGQPVLSRLVVSSGRKCAIVTSCMSGKPPSPIERPRYPL